MCVVCVWEGVFVCVCVCVCVCVGGGDMVLLGTHLHLSFTTGMTATKEERRW